MKLRKELERLVRGIATGFGAIQWLWAHCPRWDEPNLQQRIAMAFTVLPLSFFSFLYLVATTPLLMFLEWVLEITKSKDPDQ